MTVLTKWKMVKDDFAAWSSANEIVPTPLCVPCVGIMCRDLAAALKTVTVYSCVNKHLERQLVLASRYRRQSIRHYLDLQ